MAPTLSPKAGGATPIQPQMESLTPGSSAIASPNKKKPIARFNSSQMQTDLTSVYIHDDTYAWIPARVVERTKETTGTIDEEEDHPPVDEDEEIPAEEEFVQVEITLPQNWINTTTLHPDSTLGEMEEALRSNEAPPYTTRTIDLMDYVGGELPLQNLDKNGQLLGKRDMADLPFLHEAAILYNLKERHASQQPYTRVGDIVVAMNPCVWLTGLYSEETRRLYANHLIWEDTKDLEWLDNDDEGEEDGDNDEDGDEREIEVSESGEGSSATKKKKKKKSEDEDVLTTFGSLYDKLGFDPHVYETSSLAYRGLAVHQQNQTILVTGESGAGKTETVKIVMTHLATLEQSRPDFDPERSFVLRGGAVVGPETVQRVLESSPVFEAFGNAKTLRNDNSSRFGKFTQLQFVVETPGAAERAGRLIPLCQLAGSLCVTYLLEKSRVVSHSEGERTYHIFYQLLSAPNEFKRDFVWEHLDNTTVDDFAFVGDHEVIEGESDAEQWEITREALKLFQFEGESLKTLLRALCVVLQLGNLQFEEDPTSGVEVGGAVVANREELEKLSGLFGIGAKEMEEAITKRSFTTGYDDIFVHLRPSVAKEACDALAKEMYARIFDVLVRNINANTSAQSRMPDLDEKYGLISLLDIFGFERFRVNRFEQFCINYANEQLQHKYVLDNFQQVKEEYENEGIEIFDFSVVDNSEVLSLLEGRLGLILSLNEECVRPNGNDESFVYKIKIAHKANSRLIDENLHLRTEFGVMHFAGAVTYDANKFVERNTDKLPVDLRNCAAKSSNSMIQKEFQDMVNAQTSRDEALTPGKKKARNKTVLHTFRTQLRNLMSNMEDTKTRYIRCIKPNDSMIPKLTDHQTTMRQLECAGLVTAITISRESFPNKLGYESTRQRFDCLMTNADRKYMNGVELKDAVQYMLTNLLFSMVETHRNGSMTLPFACGNSKIYFKAGALEQLETKRLDYFTTRVVIIQRWTRKMQAEHKFRRIRNCAITMQAFARGRIELREYKRKREAAIVMATWVRGRQANQLVLNLRKARVVTVIQANFRRRMQRAQLRRWKRAVKVLQRAFRQKKKRDRYTAKLAATVEEARMDNKLLGLKEEISDTASLGPPTAPSAKGRQVNEELLVEIEDMFDYLRKEIFMLRNKNNDLKGELREAETDKRELLSHAESAEAAASASRLRVAQLTKNNASLMSEILDQKQEVTHLRKEVKASSGLKEEQVAAMRTDHDKVLKKREAEIKILQVNIRQTRASADYEKKLLKEEIAKMEEEHLMEVLRLKEELRRTQDSHHDYLAKLMDVLETTHQARESETARISAELNAVKEEKDAQILALQEEVEALRKSKSVVGPSSSKSKDKKAPEVAGVRRELERSSHARGQRGQKFFEVVDKLTNAVAADNLVAITSARRARGKKQSVVDEESQRMKKMIRFLSDLYALEESSQAKLDADTLKMLDNYKVAAEPNRIIGDLQFQMKQMEAENKRLKEQVRLNGTCQRCEARDKRRAARAKAANSNSTVPVTAEALARHGSISSSGLSTPVLGSQRSLSSRRLGI